MNVWPTKNICERPADNRETRLRNRAGLRSESGCGGSITFTYNNNFKVTIKKARGL